MIAPESKVPRRFWTDCEGLQRCLPTGHNAYLKAGEGTPCTAAKPLAMVQDWDPDEHVAPELQVALMRRAVDRRDAIRERCGACQRTPLVGERVYFDRAGAVYCELCRALDPDPALGSRIVHGPEFGHTMRLTDHRAA